MGGYNGTIHCRVLILSEWAEKISLEVKAHVRTACQKAMERRPIQILIKKYR